MWFHAVHVVYVCECVCACVCLMCFWSSLRVCLWLCVIVFACLRSLCWLVVPVGSAANQYCGSAESMPEAQESREEIQQQLGCQQTRTSGALEQVCVCIILCTHVSMQKFSTPQQWITCPIQCKKHVFIQRPKWNNY